MLCPDLQTLIHPKTDVVRVEVQGSRIKCFSSILFPQLHDSNNSCGLAARACPVGIPARMQTVEKIFLSFFKAKKRLFGGPVKTNIKRALMYYIIYSREVVQYVVYRLIRLESLGSVIKNEI